MKHRFLHPMNTQHILSDYPHFTTIISIITLLGLVRITINLVLIPFSVKMVKCYLRRIIILSMPTDFKKEKLPRYTLFAAFIIFVP